MSLGDLRQTSGSGWHLLGIAALSLAIALAILVVPEQISLRELERDARIAHERIHLQIQREPGVVSALAARPHEVAPELLNLLSRSGYADRAIRYELLNDKGRTVLAGGRGPAPLSGDTASWLQSQAGENMPVKLHVNRSGAGPTHYASLQVPLDLDGQRRGTLNVLLDETDNARVFSAYFELLALVTLGLLAIGIGTAATVAVQRNRERQSAQEKVRYLEQHDPLTGLTNRNAFESSLGKALARAKSDKTEVAVVCLNIDKFKQINDACEHSGGDQVLREIGTRITDSLRRRDIAARLGADEFAVALVDVANLGDVMAFMNRLVAALRPPFKVGDTEMIVAASVGVAMAPGDGDTAPTILRHATIALSRAKGDGGQRMCFFEDSMDKALQHRRSVENELRAAMVNKEFEVVYQPQIDLHEDTQIGSEALIRWHHPRHGRIAPGYFISVAEETGLIVPIGEWVLRQACRDAVNWPEHLTVAVNLSPAQFRDGDISETVAQALMESGLPAHRLELEITENLLMDNTEEVAAALDQLRALGVAIAMDDFGTGYSSLSYLARMPFSKIKIDQQFVRNVTRDPAMHAIVRTIIALGASLEVAITAEGVETEEQAVLLRKLGCRQAQGYLYGRPKRVMPQDHSKAAASGRTASIGQPQGAATGARTSAA